MLSPMVSCQASYRYVVACRVGAIVETLENSSRIRTAGEAKPKTWSPQRLPAPSRRCHNRTCCCALNVALRYCGVKGV